MSCYPFLRKRDISPEEKRRKGPLPTNPNESFADLTQEKDKLDKAKNWVIQILNERCDTIMDKFTHIYNITTRPLYKECMASKEFINQCKIRDKTVECWESTRVPIGTSRTIDSTDFIHANYVDSHNFHRRFICTQAPMKGTILDFWNMILQEKSTVIVMLCNMFEPSLDESGRDTMDIEKCSDYYPRKKGQMYKFGLGCDKFVVKNVKVERMQDHPSIIISKLLIVWVADDFRKARYVYHYHWTEWPDNDVPLGDIETFIKLSHEVRMRTSRPTIVHCSSGAGRTGTFAAILIAQESAQHGATYDKIDELLTALRLQRGKAINRPVQLLYFFRVMLHYFLVEKKEIFGSMLNDPKIKAAYDNWLVEYKNAIDPTHRHSMLSYSAREIRFQSISNSSQSTHPGPSTALQSESTENDYSDSIADSAKQPSVSKEEKEPANSAEKEGDPKETERESLQ